VTSARRVVGWACALLLAFPLRAQDRPTFDPSRDLEGFDAAYASEFREFYGVDEFSELLGKEFSGPEIEAVRARWKSAREQAEAKVRDLRERPEEASLWLLKRRLARSSYFSKITLIENRSVPGFVFLVQRPAKDVPGHAAELAERHGPWLARIAQVFDANYARPLQLVRPPTRALWAVGILASPGDYRNYWRIHPNPCANAEWACYDTKLGLVVGYDDPFQPGLAEADVRYPLLHAAVREMIFSHTTSRDGRPWAMWLEEGLASYLAYHEGASPDVLAERRIRPATLRRVVAYALDPKLRELVLHPVAEMADMREPEELDRLVDAHCAAVGVRRPDGGEVLRGFYGEATLWMHFLHRARDGALQKGFLQYVKWALSGQGGADALRVALGGEDLARLDAEFFRWVIEEHRRAFPAEKIDPAALDGLFARHDRKAAPSVAGAPTAAPEPPPFDPKSLALRATDTEASHGLALVQARSGDLERATQALAVLADTAPGDARIVRDLERLRQLQRLRDGFLANLARTGSKWTIELEGKKLVSTVRGVEGESVLLGENRLGIEKLPLASIDLLDLARQAGKKEEQGNSEPWARFYAYVLAGDARWERLLKPDSEGAKALREDAQSWIPARLRAGRAADIVNELANTPLPDSADAGQVLSATLHTLVSEYADLPVVQTRIGGLRRLAAIAVDAVLAERNPASLLHGTWMDLGDGRTSIVWEFEREDETADFVKEIGYLSEWRKIHKLEAGSEADSHWKVRDDRFSGAGAACYRIPLVFSAPMRVRYVARVLDDDAATGQANFTVGLCDDRKRNQILVSNFGHLYIRNGERRSGKDESAPESYSFFLSTDYEFEVRHDGEWVTVLVDGEERARQPCLDRKSGNVFLWFHTSLTVAVGRLEIEGKIDAASAVELRRARVEDELVRMGFPR
jgi:hypothetical protein